MEAMGETSFGFARDGGIPRPLRGAGMG